MKVKNREEETEMWIRGSRLELGEKQPFLPHPQPPAACPYSPTLDQNGEVADFVRKFVADDGDGGGEADGRRADEGGETREPS